MGTVKQIDIRIELIIFITTWSIWKILIQYYNKIDKKSYKDIGIYNIGYIAIKKKWCM